MCVCVCVCVCVAVSFVSAVLLLGRWFYVWVFSDVRIYECVCVPSIQCLYLIEKFVKTVQENEHENENEQCYSLMLAFFCENVDDVENSLVQLFCAQFV